MNITTEEYNQVLAGLRMQLQLQRRFNQAVVAERDAAQYRHKAGLESDFLRIHQLSAIQSLAEGGQPLPADHSYYSPAYAAVLKLVRGQTKQNVRKSK